MNLTLKAALGAAPLLLAAACSHDAARDWSPFTTMEPEVSPQPVTKFADANKDGKVTREEAKADPNLSRDFARYDLDKNGILDRGEFARLEADAREERVATGQSEAMEPPSSARFRGHPLESEGGVMLNRTGERGP